MSAGSLDRQLGTIRAGLKTGGPGLAQQRDPRDQRDNGNPAGLNRLASACLAIDQHKGEGRKRERVADGLPAGVALVSFECSSFNSMTDRFLSPPGKSELEPFSGRHAGTMQGPAGELIELLDT